MYMKTLVIRKDIKKIDKTFNLVQSLAGNTKIIWTIYIRSLAQTRSLGDRMQWKKLLLPISYNLKTKPFFFIQNLDVQSANDRSRRNNKASNKCL